MAINFDPLLINLVTPKQEAIQESRVGANDRGYKNIKNDQKLGILVIWREWVRLMDRAGHHNLIVTATKTYG